LDVSFLRFGPLFVDLRDRGAVFESVMAHTIGLVGIREGEATRRSFAEIVSSNYFSTLGVPLVAGRPFSLDEERPGANAPVAIASYAAWRRRGFDPGFIGSQVRVNGTPFTIVGIAPSGLRTTTLISVDWWFPLGTYDRVINEWFREGPRGLDDRANHTLFVAGALKAGLTRAAAERELDAVSLRLAEEFPATDRDRSFVLTDMPRLNLSSRPPNEAPVAFVAGLLVLMSGLVLGIACLNLATDAGARSGAAEGNRHPSGARRRPRSHRGTVADGRVEPVDGGRVASLLISWWAQAALTAWFGSAGRFLTIDGIDFTIEPSGRMVLVAGGLAAFRALCFALGPAWRLSRPSVTSQDIFDREPQSQIYVPYGARFRAAMVLHVGLGAQMNEPAMLTTVQRELRRLDEQLPILTARTMTEQRDASIPRWAVRAAAVTFGLFGALALLIASIGVYGLEAYEVARRTRELGIRMALGATTGDIKRLVLREGFRAAAVGLSLGLLLAVGIGRLVSSILYRVSPLDPAALIAAAIVLAAATLLACYIPARRATRIATLEALRTE
jgi:MacB-like periplasmic core domain/FtsX-like permease family